MVWQMGTWAKQTITYNMIGYDMQNAKKFRYVDLGEIHNGGQIAQGMEQAQFVRTLRSDSNSLAEAKSGDMVVLRWDETRIIQTIEKKPSTKGGFNFSYVIQVK